MIMNPLNWVIPPWLRVAIHLAPYLAIALLVAGLLQTRATLHSARATALIDAANMRALTAEQQAGMEADKAKAADTYAGRLTALLPLINKSRETAAQYATTPEGRAPCLAAGRVSSILEDRASIFAAASQGSDGSVQTSPTPAVGPDKR
jgi:hypothetical protein